MAPRSDDVSAGSDRIGGTALLIFLFFVPLAFSEELVGGLLDACWADDVCGVNWPVWQLTAGTDVVLMIVILLLALWLRRGRSSALRVPALLFWFGLAGAGTLGLDSQVKSSQEDYGHTGRLGLYLLMDVAWIVLLALQVAVALGVPPKALLTRRGLEWQRFRVLLPLLIGTFAAWVAGGLWDYALNTPGPPPTADPAVQVVPSRLGGEFFAQLSQVIPLLLVALAIDARFFRQPTHGRTERAAGIVTVAMMCLGEVVVLTVLAVPWPRQSLDGWHEFIAYVLGLEAALVGIVTLVWVATESVRTRSPSGQPASTDPVPVPPAPAAERLPLLPVAAAGVLVGAVGLAALRGWFRRRR